MSITLNTEMIDVKTLHSSYAYAYMLRLSSLAHVLKLVMPRGGGGTPI